MGRRCAHTAEAAAPPPTCRGRHPPAGFVTLHPGRPSAVGTVTVGAQNGTKWHEMAPRKKVSVDPRARADRGVSQNVPKCPREKKILGDTANRTPAICRSPKEIPGPMTPSPPRDRRSTG